MPLISVIITCYNVEEYLDDCLRSVVAQTLQDMEIIVVDDGSTDGTRHIIRKYEKLDPRVRTIFLSANTIGGVGSAANAGLDIANGDFVGFVDGDDYLDPGMFEKMCRAAQEGQTELAMCQYLEFDGKTGKTREPAERGCWVGIGDVTIRQLDSPERAIEILGFIAVPWRKIYARSMLEENRIRFPVVDYYWEDNPFHWFAVCSARSVSLVPEVLCYHRVDRAGQTMSSAGQDYVKIFGHHETIRQWLLQRGILPQYEVALLTWAISQYEWVVRRLPPEAGPALFDALIPVVRSSDAGTLETALKPKLRSTGTMIRHVFANERQAFLETYARRFAGEHSASRKFGARVERGLAMVELARENLKTYGARNTLTKVLMRSGLPANLFTARAKKNNGTAVTEEQMLKLLALMQRDSDQKFSKVSEQLERLQKDVEELQAKKKP